MSERVNNQRMNLALVQATVRQQVGELRSLHGLRGLSTLNKGLGDVESLASAVLAAKLLLGG
jgi:hypothetical protein